MLETNRLLIDVPKEKYLKQIFEIHADPETNQFNPNGPETSIEDFHNTYQQWQEHHDRYGYGYYVLIDKTDNIPFGVCGLRRKELKNEIVLNIYYRISSQKTRKGFVKEAAEVIINHVNSITKNKLRLVAQTKYNNYPSIKTAESLGFVYNVSYDNYNGNGNVYLFR